MQTLVFQRERGNRKDSNIKAKPKPAAPVPGPGNNTLASTGHGELHYSLSAFSAHRASLPGSGTPHFTPSALFGGYLLVPASPRSWSLHCNRLPRASPHLTQLFSMTSSALHLYVLSQYLADDTTVRVYCQSEI